MLFIVWLLPNCRSIFAMIFVPNFGGKTTYTGDLSLYASGSAEALNYAYAKILVGFGSAPKGIENNELIYELLSDMGRTQSSIDLNRSLPSNALHVMVAIRNQ